MTQRSRTSSGNLFFFFLINSTGSARNAAMHYYPRQTRRPWPSLRSPHTSTRRGASPTPARTNITGFWISIDKILCEDPPPPEWLYNVFLDFLLGAAVHRRQNKYFESLCVGFVFLFLWPTLQQKCKVFKKNTSNKTNVKFKFQNISTREKCIFVFNYIYRQKPAL